MMPRPPSSTLFPYTTLFRSRTGTSSDTNGSIAPMSVAGIATVQPSLRVRGSSDRHRRDRSEEHTSELQSRPHLVCRLLLEKKKKNNNNHTIHIPTLPTTLNI